MRRFIASSLLSLAAVQLAPATLSAQDREVPYWASLDAEEVNMRVGPSPRFPIEWVYRREGLPVKVVRTMQGWRLVQDPQGEQGWIVARLLTRERHAIVIGEGLAQMRELPAEDSPLMWQVEPDVGGVRCGALRSKGRLPRELVRIQCRGSRGLDSERPSLGAGRTLAPSFGHEGQRTDNRYRTALFVHR